MSDLEEFFLTRQALNKVTFRIAGAALWLQILGERA
jgi:hypothetical protein